MSDTVLDYLREQFARVHDRLDALRRTLNEHSLTGSLVVRAPVMQLLSEFAAY